MQDSRWVGYLRVQISRRASPKVKAVYSTRVNVEKREKRDIKGSGRTKEKGRTYLEDADDAAKVVMVVVVVVCCRWQRREGPGSSVSGVVWERTVVEDRDFRVAEVIEGSHYRYTVASLLSFALLMIYRKQINDLYSSKQITKDIAYLCRV